MRLTARRLDAKRRGDKPLAPSRVRPSGFWLPHAASGAGASDFETYIVPKRKTGSACRRKPDFERAALRHGLMLDQSDGAHDPMIPPIEREEKLTDNEG